jgi:hypothetical protein
MAKRIRLAKVGIGNEERLSGRPVHCPFGIKAEGCLLAVMSERKVDKVGHRSMLEKF